MFQVIIIDFLPPEYGDIMNVRETIHISMKKTEFPINFTQNSEKEVTSAPQVFAARLPDDEWKRLPISEKKLTSCGNCKKRDHWAAECPNRKDSRSSNDAVQRKHKRFAFIALNLGSFGVEFKNKWIADSAATCGQQSQKHLDS